MKRTLLDRDTSKTGKTRVLCIGRRVECYACGGSGLARYYGLCGACEGIGTRLVIEYRERRS